MVLAGNLCHCKISSKFVLPCLWAPVQKSMECGVFYKLLQQHRKAGGWAQCEEKINATIYLEQFATHQESSDSKAGTISGYPGSSTAPEGLDLHRNLQNKIGLPGRREGALHTPSTARAAPPPILPLTNLTFPARFLSSSLLLTSLIKAVRSSAIVN